MRDDDRRRRFSEDDDLFSELGGEAERPGPQAPPAGTNFSLGPKGAAEPGAGAAAEPSDDDGRFDLDADPAGAAPPPQASYPPEGFDSDEQLDHLPNLSPEAPHPRAGRAASLASRPSRLILGVVCLAVVGAVFLFWRPGSKPEPPLGIGERTSVVTPHGARTSNTPAPPATPDVDIASVRQPLVGERGAAQADPGTQVVPPSMATPTVPAPRTVAPQLRTPTAPNLNSPPPQLDHPHAVVMPRQDPPRFIPQGNSSTKTGAAAASGTARATGGEYPRSLAAETATATTASAPAPTASPVEPSAPTPAPAAAGLQPGADGPWVLQLGAFATQDNAQALITKLKTQGLEPRLQAGTGSRGALFYKVTIGYFATREAAASYAAHNARLVGPTAHPIHR